MPEAQNSHAIESGPLSRPHIKINSKVDYDTDNSVVTEGKGGIKGDKW